MECGGVSGTGVVERLGSELVKSVLPSSLSSSSQSADMRPREWRERLLLLSPLACGFGWCPGLRRPGKSLSRPGRSGGSVLEPARRPLDAAGIFGGVSHRISLAQSSSVYVSLLASSRCLRIVLAPERAEVDVEEPVDLAPADSVRGRELGVDEAIVMVSTELAACLAPRSELPAVVGRVDVPRDGSENSEGGSSPPLVDDATDDSDEPDGVRETGGVSSSDGLGAETGFDLVWRGSKADASTGVSSIATAEIDTRDKAEDEAREARGV